MKQIFSLVTVMFAATTICYSQANTKLSNLVSPTAVNVNLIPGGKTGTKNFGSDNKRWKNGYFNATVYAYGTGSSYGIYGSSVSNFGVYGTSGYIGVYGTGNSYGVYGYSAGNYGVYGNSGNIGVYGTGASYGIYGSGGTYGLYASGSTYGVYGSGFYAVYGHATGGYGGTFISDNGHGLYAKTGSTASNIYAAIFQGNTYCYGTYNTSDERVKKNLADFKDGMTLINQLKPKIYQFRNDGQYTNLRLPKGNHFGLLAQDVEKLLPGLVGEAPLEDENTTAGISQNVSDTAQTALQTQRPKRAETMQVKAINYTELIPVIVKGMQELDAENKNLKKQVSDMQDELAQLRQLVQNLSVKANGVNNAASFGDASLQQNQPNPFAGKTIIPLNVPANAKHASLTIAETGSGKVIKTITVAPGSKQISVDRGVLSNGAYTYTLLVDGKKIDSRQMTVLH
jgi:hypothetical protein